jgi:hypothetical protein
MVRPLALRNAVVSQQSYEPVLWRPISGERLDMT